MSRDLTIVGPDIPPETDFVVAVIQTAGGDLVGSGLVPFEDGIAFQEHPGGDEGAVAHLLGYTRERLEIPEGVTLQDLVSSPITRMREGDPELPPPSFYRTGDIIDGRAVLTPAEGAPPALTVSWLKACERALEDTDPALVEGLCPQVCATVAAEHACNLVLSGQPEGSCFNLPLSLSLVGELEVEPPGVLSECMRESKEFGERFAFSCVRTDNDTEQSCHFRLWSMDQVEDPFEVDSVPLFEPDPGVDLPVNERPPNISPPLLSEDGWVTVASHPDPMLSMPHCRDDEDAGAELVYFDGATLEIMRRADLPPCISAISTRSDGTGLFGLQSGVGSDRRLYSFDTLGTSSTSVAVPSHLPFEPFSLSAVGDHLIVGYLYDQPQAERRWPFEVFDASTLDHLFTFEYLDGTPSGLIPHGDELIAVDGHLDSVRVLAFNPAQNTYEIQVNRSADLKFPCVTIRPAFAIERSTPGSWFVADTSGSGSAIVYDPRRDPSCVQRPFFAFPGSPETLLRHPKRPDTQLIATIFNKNGPSALGVFQIDPPRFLPAYSSIGEGYPTTMVKDEEDRIFLTLRNAGTLIRAQLRE